jgi:hypothetical protein
MRSPLVVIEHGGPAEDAVATSRPSAIRTVAKRAGLSSAMGEATNAGPAKLWDIVASHTMRSQADPIA